MNRFVCSILVLGLALTIAPFAAAQGGPAVTGLGGEDRALGLHLYGDLDAQMRYGCSGFTTGASGDNIDDPVWGGSPEITIGLKAALADKASVVIELRTPRIEDGEPVNYFGNNSGESGGFSGSDIEIGIHQAYLNIQDALIQDLDVTFGIQELVFDVVGNDNPLLMALGRAEVATTEGMNVGWNANAFDEAAAGGLRLDYAIGEAGSITVFHMIVDQDTLRDMEMVTGVRGIYGITEKTSIEAMIALINGADNGALNGDESMIWLIGIGAASNGEFVEGLDIFGQVGFNAGTYGTSTALAPADEVDASGLMFNVGANYQLVNVAWKPKFGVEYLLVTGNEPDATGDDEYEGFVSYEDNDDLIVLEDNEFGFDVDQNYSVIKIRASITGDLAGAVQDNFTLEVLLGIAKLDEEIGAAPNEEDGLGTELDIKASWAASKQVTVYGGLGWLFASDVLEEVVSNINGVGAEEYDSAVTFFVGTNVTF